MPDPQLSRRALLGGAAAVGLTWLGASCGGSRHTSPTTMPATTAPAGRPGPAGVVLEPGQRPNPRLPEGTDTIPALAHIVVLMMENHSFDDHLGLLGRGDGLRVEHGVPVNACPDGHGHRVRAFEMPSGCQLDGKPSQSWTNSHISWNGGRNDGFVKASGPVAMGYWTDRTIPFYWGLARTFPLCDRWFCSVLAQTFPNRRFLIAGTARGLVDDHISSINEPLPPNGTIFQLLDAHRISWRDYFTDLPTAGLWAETLAKNGDKVVPVDRFFTDAAAGALPSFSIVDPNYSTGSEEDPDDIRVGEAFAAKVINAVMHGPAWDKTLLVWCYDEHGGYYDHVPPPPAAVPDDVPPHLPAGAPPGGYDRYGFRVPAVIVSPFAKRDHVSHVVHDHTSILKLVETKWNLPALTRRDGAADDLLDSLDTGALFHGGRPPFAEPPSLPEPELAQTGARACKPGDPGGPIPPPAALLRG